MRTSSKSRHISNIKEMTLFWRVTVALMLYRVVPDCEIVFSFLFVVNMASRTYSIRVVTSYAIDH